MTEKSLLVLSVWLLSEEFDDFFSLEKISLGGIHYLLTDMAVSPPGAHQAPLSMGFPRQKDWSGLPFPPPGDLPAAGIQSTSPALAGKFLTTESPGKQYFLKKSTLETTSAYPLTV